MNFSVLEPKRKGEWWEELEYEKAVTTTVIVPLPVVVVVPKLEDILLPVPLTFYFKNNGTPFEAKYCKKIYTVESVVKFWQVWNNVDFWTLLQYGTISLQVKDKLPLWDMNCGTYSNIMLTHFEDTWRDLSLFLVSNVLNCKDTKINGVTLVVKKGKFFNAKISTSGTQPEELDLPEYFGTPKFMLNNERDKQEKVYQKKVYTKRKRN